ncbi:MAG: ABC transporter permease [Candidatus Omnitrophota bacterium]
MPYELMISLRYLFSRKRKGFISFMSFVSILGVAVGVACLITVLAVMNGFGDELQKRIIGSNPHIIIEKEGGISTNDYKLISDKLLLVSGVSGYYSYIWGQGVLRFRSRAHGAVVRSVDANNSTDISKLEGSITAGEIRISDGEAIIGSELASTLGVFLDDELEIITPLSKKAEKIKVTGIFNSGYYEYDLNLAYVNLNTASGLFGMEEYISGIGIDIYKIDNAAVIKQKIREILPDSYYVRTWMDLNSNLFSALKLEKWAMFVILTLIIIVASLNIISTLSVMVVEKTKDIGILKAIGATRKSIMAIFSLQGIIIGFWGVVFGCLGGFGLSAFLKTYKPNILPESIYYGISYLPVSIDLDDSYIIMACALLISFLASIYPAYQASRLNPVDALRYE